jgi:hypothetical protein
MGGMGGSILPHSTLGHDSNPNMPSTAKADGATLAAEFGLYPGYVGKLMPDGEAIVRFNMDGSFHLKLDVAGVEQGCTACGVHIHTGTTCDNATLVGGHYWDTAIFGEGAANDPWNVWGFYKTDILGMTTTAFAGDSGVGYELNVGRAAVLHAAVSADLTSSCFEFECGWKKSWSHPPNSSLVDRMELVLPVACWSPPRQSQSRRSKLRWGLTPVTREP